MSNFREVAAVLVAMGMLVVAFVPALLIPFVA